MKTFISKCLILSAAFAVVFTATAQEDNLVPNGSFENSDLRKLKSQGQLEEFTENWFSATEAALDLYAEGMKSEKVNIPNNVYGKQDAADGLCYAGFRAFSKDPKLPRTYFEVELATELEKNQLYCVSFDISLSDLSRYGVNGVGAFLSDRKIEQGNTGILNRDASVLHKSDKVMSLQDGWETVCGTFIGTGEEEYIIVGGFHKDNEVEDEKMKKPQGMTGVVKNHAYYYLDNVKVSPIEAKSQCACSAADEVRTDLVYGSSVVLSESMTPDDIVSISAVYYAFLKRRPTGAGSSAVANLANILKENPTWKLRVIGHTDEDEFNEGKINPRYRGLGEKRANQVVVKFGEFGIEASRLLMDTMENSDPASTRDTDISRAKNRRVTFELIK
jgi:outer membrane protein OmpA-like peptidoglycan-associated protein|tara:strand:+ start:5690 stop:6856 length:1167 start_codon:yes stop_codon:yes gene_type:complete